MKNKPSPLAWSCYRCHRTAHRRLTSDLCKVCWADLDARGLRWCSRGKHAEDKAAFSPGNTRCRACLKRKLPAGFISVPTLARRLGFAPGWVTQKINAGWLAGHVTRGPRNMWLVPDWPSYPAWEAWERPPTEKRRLVLDALSQAVRLTSAQIAGATGLPKQAVWLELKNLRKVRKVRCEDRLYWRLGR